MQSINYRQIKDTVRLDEILSRYVQVPMGRKSFRIPCPFHLGQDQNCYVDNERGFIYCHVCGWSGDVISVVAHFNGQSMQEAANALVREHGLRLDNADEVKQFYVTTQQLQNLREAREQLPIIEALTETEELEEGYRGYSKETINRFGLKRVTDPRWPGAIYIPCRTPDGSLVGYSFRMPEGSKWKYLFSKGFKKVGVLFGLYENGEAIKEKGWALVVEGQFDVLSMYEKGFDNCVALFSCHMSIYQSYSLMNYTNNLVILFDGDHPDKTGRRAGQQGAIDIKQRFGSAFNIRAPQLPDGTCVRDLNKETIQQYV